MRMRHIICGLYGSTIFSQKWHNFRENIIEHKMCVLIFSTTLSQTLLILRRIQRHIIINVPTYLREVPVIRVIFK